MSLERYWQARGGRAGWQRQWKKPASYTSMCPKRSAGCRGRQWGQAGRTLQKLWACKRPAGCSHAVLCCPPPGLLPSKEGKGEEGGNRNTGWTTFSRWRRETEQRLPWGDLIFAAAFLGEEHLRIIKYRGKGSCTEAEVAGAGGRRESGQYYRAQSWGVEGGPCLGEGWGKDTAPSLGLGSLSSIFFVLETTVPQWVMMG